MDIEKIIKEVREAIIEGSEQVANSIMDSEAFEKYRNSPDKIGDFVDDLSVGINHLGDQIGDWFEKAKESTEPVRRRTKAAIYERIYAEYRKAGLPFGDTHDGFMKWVNQNGTELRAGLEKGLDGSREAILSAAKQAKSAIENALQPKNNDEAEEVDSVIIEETIDRVLKETQSTDPNASKDA